LGVFINIGNTGMPMTTAVHVIDGGGAATAALHPLRLEILRELAEPESAAGLARRIGIPRQQVNYHIRRLEEQGLVELVGERRVRNCIERLVQAVGRSFVISPAALGELAADPARIEDEGSAAYLVAVVSEMVQEVAGLQHGPGQPDKDVRTLALRADIRFRSQQAQNAFAAELTEEIARLVAKYHVARAAKGRLFRVLASAYPVLPH
jgi:DNA-binding transcriptional ArsR family regulator